MGFQLTAIPGETGCTSADAAVTHSIARAVPPTIAVEYRWLARKTSSSKPGGLVCPASAETPGRTAAYGHCAGASSEVKCAVRLQTSEVQSAPRKVRASPLPLTVHPPYSSTSEPTTTCAANCSGLSEEQTQNQMLTCSEHDEHDQSWNFCVGCAVCQRYRGICVPRGDGVVQRSRTGS